jgi:hypothetical protein
MGPEKACAGWEISMVVESAMANIEMTLVDAAMKGDVDGVRRALAAGASAQAADDDGTTSVCCPNRDGKIRRNGLVGFASG